MSDTLDPLLRVKALQEVAKLQPDPKFGVSTFWTNEHCTAGVVLYDAECAVFLHDARQVVESLSHATDILRRIFADEVVAVRAYSKEEFVHIGLAPKNDPSAALQGLTQHGKDVRFPVIDRIETASWLHGYREDIEKAMG